MNTHIIVAHGAMAGELLAEALKSSFTVVGRASTSTEVVEKIKSVRTDVAVIAASLQDGPLSGFRALREVRKICPDLRCVMLLERSEPDLVVDAFHAGARGVFCPALSEFKLLCKCISSVHAGQIWANSRELTYVMDALSRLAPLRISDANGIPLLTEREEQVVRLLAEGLTNREIAKELGLSAHTIKNYLFRIFDKVGVSSRVELVMYAVNSTKRASMSVIRTHVPEKTLRYIDPPKARKLSHGAADPILR